MAIAAQVALATSEHTSSSAAQVKTGTPPAAHRSPSHAHPKAARPAPPKTTARDHKKEPAARPAAGPAKAADKSGEQRPLFGPFSFGLETDTKVKRRSIRGGEYDPERDGDQGKGFRPSFLGLSLTSPFSW